MATNRPNFLEQLRKLAETENLNAFLEPSRKCLTQFVKKFQNFEELHDRAEIVDKFLRTLELIEETFSGSAALQRDCTTLLNILHVLFYITQMPFDDGHRTVIEGTLGTIANFLRWMSRSEFDAVHNFVFERAPQLSVLYNEKSNYFVMKSILMIVFQIVSKCDDDRQRQEALTILTNSFDDSAEQLQEILAWNADSLNTLCRGFLNEVPDKQFFILYITSISLADRSILPHELFFSEVIWQKRNVRFTTSEGDSAPLDREIANENILSYQIIDDNNDPRVRVLYTGVTTATADDAAEETTVFHVRSIEDLQSLQQFLTSLIGHKEFFASTAIDHEHSPTETDPIVVLERVSTSDIDQEECSPVSIASELDPSESEIFAEKFNDYNDQVSGSLVPSPRSDDAQECYEESGSSGDELTSEANAPIQNEPRSIAEEGSTALLAALDPYNIEHAREQSVCEFGNTNWRARLLGKEKGKPDRPTRRDSIDVAAQFPVLQSSTPIRHSKRSTYPPSFVGDANENAPDADDHEDGAGRAERFKPWKDQTRPRSRQIRVKYMAAETLTTTGMQGGKYRRAAKSRVLVTKTVTGSVIRTKNTENTVTEELDVSEDWDAINDVVQRQLCALDTASSSADLEERRRPLCETERDGNAETTEGSPPKKRAVLGDLTNTSEPRLALARQEFNNPVHVVEQLVNNVAKPMVFELSQTFEKNRQETEALAAQLVESAEADIAVIMQMNEKYNKLMGEAKNTLAEMSRLALEYRRKHLVNSNIDSLIQQTIERDEKFVDTVRVKREDLGQIQNSAFTIGWRLHRQIYLDELAKFVSEFD